MAILSVNMDPPGQVGQLPRRVSIVCNDTYAAVTAAGYLNQVSADSYTFYQNDQVVIAYGANSQLVTTLQPSIALATGVITLGPVGQALTIVDVVVGESALASGGSVTLFPSAGTQQYKVRGLWLNTGTNFSGNSGNRLGSITDGTTVYSLIPAANMQALTNSAWGSTALPAPASATWQTATVAGESLVFKYSGGSADYSAGSLTITAEVERIA